MAIHLVSSSINGVEWANSCGCEALTCSLDIPFSASVSASSFPVMFACALILYNIVSWVLCIRKLTISSRMVLYGWFLCSVGCFIWFFLSHILGH